MIHYLYEQVSILISAWSTISIIGLLWAMAGIFLLMLELGTPGLFFFLAFAVGCFFSALVAFLSFSFFMQAGCFLIFSCITFMFMRHYFVQKNYHKMRTNSDALINQEAVVTVTIEPYKPGRVKIKGDDWPAIVDKAVSFKEGTVVTIIRIEGNKLIVR